MRKLSLICLSAFMWVSIGCGERWIRTGGMAVAPGKYFSVAVEQDGRKVPVIGHTVYLKRRPFALIFAFRDLDSVMVNASFSPKLYEAVRDGRPVESVLPLEGRGMAEYLFNRDREIFIRDDAYHFWHYYGPKNHRFDDVKKVGDLWICRRTVERCVLGHGTPPIDIRKMTQRGMYLVFVKTAWDRMTKKRVAKQTDRLRIIFR